MASEKMYEMFEEAKQCLSGGLGSFRTSSWWKEQFVQLMTLCTSEALDHKTAAMLHKSIEAKLKWQLKETEARLEEAKVALILCRNWYSRDWVDVAVTTAVDGVLNGAEEESVRGDGVGGQGGSEAADGAADGGGV